MAEEKLGNAEQAAALFNKAIALKPDYAEAHMRLGILHARAKENDAASEELRTAVAADTDSAEAHYNLAKLLALLAARMSRSVRCRIVWPSIRLTSKRACSPATCSPISGDVGRAAAAYEEVLRRKPEFAEAHNNLGLLWLNAGKIDLAQNEFRAALKIKPDYSAAQRNLDLASQNYSTVTLFAKLRG